jgi:hypothetical protein
MSAGHIATLVTVMMLSVALAETACAASKRVSVFVALHPYWPKNRDAPSVHQEIGENTSQGIGNRQKANEGNARCVKVLSSLNPGR